MLTTRFGSLGFGFLRLMSAIAVLLAIHSAAYTTDWLDNFNDGNAEDGMPVTWTYDGDSALTPGTYWRASGDYSLSNPGSGGSDDNLIATVNESFTTTYLRTQTVIVPGPRHHPGQSGSRGTLGSV